MTVIFDIISRFTRTIIDNSSSSSSRYAKGFQHMCSQSIQICVFSVMCFLQHSRCSHHPMLIQNGNGSMDLKWLLLKSSKYAMTRKYIGGDSIIVSFLTCAPHACMHKSNEKFNHNNKWNVCGWANTHPTTTAIYNEIFTQFRTHIDITHTLPSALTTQIVHTTQIPFSQAMELLANDRNAVSRWALQ